MTLLRLIAMAILLIPTTVLAEEHSSQHLGFVGGPTYGVGLSYGRQNTSTGIGWQVSGTPVWLEEDRLFFGGFTLFKTLHEGGEEGRLPLRLFLSGGFALFYSWHDNRDSFWIDDREIDENLSLVFGPGVGGELRIEPFALLLDLPISFIFNGSSEDESFLEDSLLEGDRRDRTEFQIIPYYPNIGLVYRW